MDQGHRRSTTIGHRPPCGEEGPAMPRTPRTSADHSTPAPESPAAAPAVADAAPGGLAGELTIHPLAEAFPRMSRL
jgi:hypothetical protein